ncbi:type II toxin-antitoxin system Phd/YefM family antitoxin [Photorhabdus africana]|uniref:type II toxin-antitoxin system Phd/YefM family antitoxin n=1 Tax=Photorhabdus africana TaxID=3097554 RepID=UPI002B40F1DA|nr:type II toxin-antitoxin system Phd/YefM family antitoxin [Photorhabdus sp. CRI-LC]
MSITTLSSRELNQDVSRAKKAAKSGPVFITDRGKPAHVLLTIEEYQRITKQRRNIADALAMPGVEDIEFNPPRVAIPCSNSRPANFS